MSRERTPTWARIVQRVTHLFSGPHPGGPAGILWHLFNTIRLFVVGLRQSQLTRMAAAMTYRTLFGLIPVLLVGLVALAAFSTEEQQSESIKRLLHYAGLDQIEVREEMGPPAPGHEAMPKAASPRLDQWIQDLVQRGKAIPYGKIQVLGILTLIYAAISMLVEIEKAFNQIYNAPEGRSWLRRIVQYWALLTLGPLLLILSFTLMTYIQGKAESIALLEGTSWRRWVLAGVGFITTTATSTILLTIIYTTVPNARVHAAPAFLGAMTAAVLWESGKLAITTYVRSSTGMAQLYGAVAVLPLFLMWLYVSWLIVLVGLQLSYSMQTYRAATAKGLSQSVLIAMGLRPDPNPPGRPRLLDAAAPLTVMVAVAERFVKGQATDHTQVVERTGLDALAASDLLEKLAGAGLLHRVSAPERDVAYALTRPADVIRAGEVLDAFEPHAMGAGSGTRLAASAFLARARREALAGKTLADLAEPAAKPEPAPGEQPAARTIPA